MGSIIHFKGQKVKNLIFNTFSVLLLLCIANISLLAHTVQIAYCITNEGKVRVYFEHWHNNLTVAQTATAQVNMTVFDPSTGMTTAYSSLPAGVVWDTELMDLPDCKTAITVVETCSRANTEFDWAYWEFTPPACFVDLTININSVTGSTAYIFDPQCGTLIPTSLTDSFVDCVAPSITCPEDMTVDASESAPCGSTLDSELEPSILFDDCTAVDDLEVRYRVFGATTASGDGFPTLFFPKGISTVQYAVTDETDKTSTCEFTVTVDDLTPPTLSCPSDLSLDCDAPDAQGQIDAWLASYVVSDACDSDVSVVTSYSDGGFSMIEDQQLLGKIGVRNLGMSSTPFVHNAIKELLKENRLSTNFIIKETTNKQQYDRVIQTRVKYLPGMATDFSDILIIDSKRRLIPIDFLSIQEGKSALLKMKIPELKAGQDNSFNLLYGACHEFNLNFQKDEKVNTSDYLIVSDVLSNSIIRESIKPKHDAEDAAVVMPCNCTASQGASSFDFQAIQNPLDDVEFYIFGNSGVPQAASSNTGFECNDQVVIFLYENTLTGEVSLFVLIDAAGGGNGGSGSLDFYCLPTTATVDHSDDNGEITGLFPTVTANWRWADCCTDGAVIGNVGCNQTFDVYPQFASGINSIKWVTGTPAAPVYHTFDNITDPIRISCGDANPSCCPNSNTVAITNATCPSSTNGAINIVPDATGGPYDFTWSNGATTEDISNLAVGDYTVTITDSNDCEQISTYTVDVENKPELTCSDQTIQMSGNSITLEEGVNVLYSLDYDCPDNTKVSCTGCGDYDCTDQNMMQTITLLVTDELSNTDECIINVTIQNNPPDLTCPSDLTIGCIDPNGDDLIDTWLSTATSTDPEGGTATVADNYSAGGFMSMVEDDFPRTVSGKQSFDEGPHGSYLSLLDKYTSPPPPPTSGTQVVTFTATDDCGNTASCTASIIIVDNTDPVITCPSDITIECGDPNNDAILTNWMDNATATDACDDNIIITNNFTALSAQECGGITTVTFTAADTEGNTTICRSTATHEDSTPPEFLMKPQDITVECINVNGGQPAINAWTAANGNGMAMDACDPTLRWSFILDSQEELCGYTYLRTYTFTVQDDCGNSSTSVATALVEDTTPPVINLVWDELIQTCTINNETNLAGYLEQNKRATDLCSATDDITIEWVLFNDISSCGGTIDRTYLYTATDACGNTSTDYFHYMTTDVAVPTWANVPGTLVIECGDEDNPLIITQWMQDVEESMFDACGGELAISNNFSGDLPEACNQNTVVIWTVEDECGNSRTLNRTIAVRDFTNPVIINCPDDFTVNVDVDNCSSNVIFSTPIGYDQCTDLVTVNQTVGPASGSTFPVGTTRIVFEAVDDCGRRSNPDCDFNITVVDSDIPTIDCSFNAVEVCASEGTCVWIGDDSISPVAMENCATANITYTVTGATTSTGNTTAVGLTYQLGTSTVCYTVTDAAGNMASCCFDVIVSDCEDPIVNCPADQTVICDSAGNTASLATWLGSASASDNCSTTFTFTNQRFNTISGCGDANTTVYQFAATDESGNETQCLASFIIEDTSPPEITTPPCEGTSDCNNVSVALLAWLNNHAGAEASDACGSVSWSHDFDGEPMTPCSMDDEEPDPLKTGGLIDHSTWTEGSGSDAGYNAIGNPGEDNRIIAPDPWGNKVVVWEAGNDAVSGPDGGWNTDRFLIDNTKTYRFSTWINRKELGANGRAYLGVYGYGTTNGLTNVANGATTTNPYFWFSGSPPTMIPECEWVLVVGHVYPHTHTGTTVHPESGIYTVTNDRIANTIADYKWLPQTTEALHRNYLFYSTDTDVRQQFVYPRVDCVDGTEPSIAELRAGYDVEGGNHSSICVTFTATDECGNATSTKAWFNVEDEEPPTITCPEDITLECGDVLNEVVTALWKESASAIDNCSDAIITIVDPEDFAAACGTTGVTTTTFLATDDCGNTSSCVATISIEDTRPPSFLMKPQDLIVECGPDATDPEVWIMNLGGAMAEDHCDTELTWEVTEGEASSGCGDSQEIEYIFTVTDECNNISTATAYYIFEDTQSPTVIPPADITVECSAVATTLAAWQAGASASDACGDGFTFEAILFNTISDCGDSMTEVYQFTATDACGNQGTALASYTIQDTADPTITCPEMLMVNCGQEGNDLWILNWLNSVTGSDTCGDLIFSNDFDGMLPENCGGLAEVTFTAEDACGNTSSCASMIMHMDHNHPTFPNCPENLTVNVDVDECGSNPIFSTPIAEDNCGVTVVQTVGIASGNTFPVGTTQVEFLATDECGQTATCQFEITVVDSDEPLILCPSLEVVACADAGECHWTAEDIGPSLGQENCPDFTTNYTVTGATTAAGNDDASGVVFEYGLSEVCYTITDDSDNTASCCFNVVVNDCEEPEVTCPDDLVVECDGLGNTTALSDWLEDVSGTDNCDLNLEFATQLFNTASACGGGEAVTYEFVVTDDEDNSAGCVSTFTIEDMSSPVITAATNLVVECDGTGDVSAALLEWLSTNGGATATDLCSDLSWTNDFSALTDECGSTGTTTVIFTVTDACGNTATSSAEYTIVDTADPLITCPTPITLECNDLVNAAVIENWLSSATGSDSCSEVELVNTYPAVLVTGCTGMETHTITFTVTDACDHTATCSSTISILDTTLPTFELDPEDLILECADGNNPALIAAWIANNGTGVASDNCSDITWSEEALTAIPACGNTSETPYIFTVTDACGNTSTRSASVVIENTTDPVIAVPDDLVIECDGTGNVADLNDWLIDVTGSSDCGLVSTEYELYNTISACGGGSTEVYIFTATDDCGNESTGLASFTIEDTSNPTPVCPSTLVLECGNPSNDLSIAAWLLAVDISDATGCSSFALTNNYPGTLPGFLCDGDPGIVVQFTATDDCGNTGVCQALITLDDTIEPTFANCPTDLTVNVDTDLCSSNVVYSQPVALDQCDNSVEVALTSGISSGTSFPIGTTTILFTATDDCRNTSTCTFDITVVDSSIPSIACPSNTVIVCTDEGLCTWAATEELSPVFSENCDMAGYDVTYVVSGVTMASSPAIGLHDVAEDLIVFQLGSSEVCYTIEDAVGNSASCCFDVIVEDCELPEITCPSDLVVECDGADNTSDLAGWLAAVTSIDNCAVSLSLSNQLFNTISACGETNALVYEFTSEDDFGNISTCFAEFTIEDTVAPVIDVAASSLVVECSGTGNSASLTAWLNDVGGAEASDLCNEVAWTHDFTTPLASSCEGGSITTVIFTARDECGNTTTTSADFVVEDTTEPVVECPSSITLECAAGINEAIIENWLNGVNAFDTCSEVEVVNDYGSVFAAACGETGEHTVTFTATDDCGNASTCAPTITIEDTTPPTIVAEPVDLLLECAGPDNASLIADWEASFGGAVATDACSDEALVWTILSQNAIGACGDTESTLYVFQVTDNCENTATAQASVVIEDTTEPVLNLPEEQIEECGAIEVTLAAWLAEATASDDCGAVTIESELWNTISACGGGEARTYIFTATDACGNETTGLADYIIEDTTDPTPVCPNTLALTCGNENNDQLILNWLDSATGSDANDCSAYSLTSEYPGGLPVLTCDGGTGTPVVFTATDDCGNTSTCTSTITMDDANTPYFSNCPLDLIVNVDVDLCETNVIYSQPIALDNCDENVDVTMTSGIASGAAFPIGTTTILFTATDACGNTSTCEFDITVVDSDIPSISCPSNDVYVCTDEGTCEWEATEESSAIFADNCADEGYTVTYAITGATIASSPATGVNDIDEDNIVFNLGASEVCYTITDEAGNSAKCCFDIIVEDCESPTLICSDELDVACGAEDLSAWFDGIAGTMMDNCDGDLVLDTLLITDFSSCGTTFERVYLFTATDAAGNTSTCLATYETDDTVSPVISDAEDLTLECAAGSQSTALLAWLNNNGGATFTSDNCSADVSWTNDYTADLVTSCGANGATLVTFTATDDCGNTATTTATFTIEDNTPPVFTCPDDITLECSGAINAAVISNWLASVRSVDACQGVMEVVDNYGEVFAEACGSTGVYTVTFTSSDPCDNVSTCDRTVTIIDTTDPIIDVQPQDLVLECAGDVLNPTLILDWEENFGGAAATDACSDEPLSWTILETLSLGGCGNTGSTLYTFMVTDNCGNTSTTQASVTLEDTTPPVLTLPENQIEECNNIVTTLEQWLAEVSGTDGCGTVTFDSRLWNTVSGCGGTDIETYEFVATDACGNQTTGFATYTIQDTSDPTISCPANLALTCGNEANDQAILSWLNAATATDEHGCSSINSTNDFPDDLPILDCNDGEGIDITFTATDECGNTDSCTATITMDDAEAPYFSNCPVDMTVNVDVGRCGSNIVYSQPIALDDCDEDVDVALIDGIPSGNPFPIGTTTITFEAVDGCGNTSTCSFDLTVLDSDAPSISCPSNDVVVCTDPATCTWLSTDQTDPIYNDNCPGQVLTYEVSGATTAASATTGENTTEADGVVFNLGKSEVVYTITDPSDNVASCSFDVIVKDCESPTITCNDQLDIACGAEDLGAWFDGIAATVLDNCDAIPNLEVDTLLLTDFSSCGATFHRVYMYVVTDVEGNTSSCLATYETDDNVVPEITVEAQDLVLECRDANQSTALLAWLNNIGGAAATDVCSGPVTWTNDFVGDLTGSCGGNGEVLVTFTATDDCENSSTTSATFRIEDMTPPVLSCPENLVLECSDRLNDAVIANWLRTATANDECEGKTFVTHNYPDVLVDACGNTGEFTVTFTTVDNCDNETNCNRTITIVDTTAPDIFMDAEDLELSCGSTTIAADIADWLTDNGGAAATDVCSDEALVWTNEITETGDGCGGFATTTYTFIVTDNCGNSATTSAAVVVSDDTEPTFDTGPQDQVIECYPTGNEVALINWLNNNGGAVVSDDCATAFEWEYDLINVIDNCGNTLTRVYRFIVTDDCGNTSTAEANFEIHDTTNPEITKEAEEFTTQCNGSSNSAEILSWLNNNGYAEATDRCGNITWSNDYGTIVADCGATGGVEVTFTATDECGNSTTTSANFIINDEVDPYWILAPQNLEVECDGSNDPMGQIESWLNLAGGGEAADDCSAITYSNDFSIINLECDMEGGVEVVFTVTDACGNFATSSAMLIITDDVPPIITVEAANETVECDGAGNSVELQAWLDAQAYAEAEDACSAVLTWNYELRSSLGSCGNTSSSIYDFTATDACGNVSVATMAAFIIEDTTEPLFDILPTDETVECDGEGNDAELQSWLDSHGGAVASDICSEPISWEYDLVMDEDSCGITGIQVFRFTITDDCGNSYSEEATFIIEDTTDPVITPGEDMNMEECDDNITGNILDFDFWLESNAGASAEDACGEMTWSNDYHPDNWVTTCGNTRYVDVVFTVADACGNSSDTQHRFGVGDVTPPEFINCPRPPVVNDAPDGWCSAYANYATPIAEDNCSALTVTQVDDSGLQSGDLFPVGLTIITFVAEDECGNSSTCELKIIINDFHTPPSIVCPDNVEVENDPSMCGAIVDNIAPVNVEDNCPDNLSVIYEVLDGQGETIACGFEDASGQKFPTGSSTVEYTVIDQPLLLITEIIQDGTTTGVELTNFGPGALDITCLDIVREGPDNETYNVPNGTVLSVGEVYTQLFTDVNSASAAGYYLSFVGTIIDGVSINGHTSTIYPFTGSVFGENIYRKSVCDHDGGEDFAVASSCFSGSFGSHNPGLPTMTDNGSTVALQEAVPSSASCSFVINVVDTEPAFCAEYDTIRVCIPTVIDLAPGACTNIPFSVPAGVTVGDVNLVDLVMTHPDAGDLSFHLTSPPGTSIFLLGGLCSGDENVDISLDDTADLALATVSCDPLGQGDYYRPIGDFSDFFDESAGGTWMLNVTNAGEDAASLESVCLEVLELVAYGQADVYLENDPGDCGAQYTWQQPQISDNCGLAIMTVTYETNDQISLPASGDVQTGAIVTEFFSVGTTRVIYTILDQYGNKSICGFEVVVEDNEIPVVDASLCMDQTIQLAANQCFVPTSALSLPPLLDNCGSSNISFTPGVSQGFPSGDHPLVLGFTDAFGNNASCNFMVTVLPFVPSSDQMICVGQINLSLDADCEEEITAGMMLAPGGMHGCTDDYCVTVTDEQGNEVPGALATEEHIGQLLTVKVCTDCNGGNCCWGNILIENKLIPSIDCPDPKVTIVCNEIFEPSVVGEPILETCEQEVYFSYEDNITFGDMCDEFPGSIERIWTITDESNNTIECLQEITIERFDITAVAFPRDTIITTADIDCVDVEQDPMLIHPDHTGYPDLNGVPISETGDGLCSHFWNWDDQILYNCEGSYEILRKWLVRDMCEDIVWGTNPIEYYQSIKVIDNMPPQFEGCQDDLVFASADFDCSTDVYLNDYMPEIIEVCGSIKDTVFSVSPGTIMERPAGSGNYYLTNMAPGIHTVKITVRDQCSNYNRCTFNIEVEDKNGPNVLCEQDLNISLNSIGVAEVPAEVLDDGSFDNCTSVLYQIYRMDDNCDNPADLEPGAYVTFCCNDVSTSPHQVMLRVWDDADGDGMHGSVGDYYNECMVRVAVNDATIPELTCPADLVIDCDQDYKNLNLTGQPSIGSACSFVDANFVDDVAELTDCTTGAVLRTWNIVGYDIDCKQTISITAAMPFTENDIVWPQDFEGDCSDMNVAAQPIVNSPECSQIGIDVKSDTFFFNEAACYKVVNNWEVIDWCQYDNSVDPIIGSWTHQQVIKITSSELPAITGCGDKVVAVESADCTVSEITVTNSAIDNSCGAASVLNWNYQIDLANDGNIDTVGSVASANPSVTVTDVEGGMMTVIWQVVDGCGNAASCTQRVFPEDGKSPTAYCTSISTVVMEEVGEVALWASDIDAGSTDNCTAQDALLLSFDEAGTESSMIFDCDDIPNGMESTFDVTIYVTDEAGNQSNCMSQLTLQDPSNACPDVPNVMGRIGGIVANELEEPIEDVQTYLEASSSSMDDMDMTDAEGAYAFDQLPMTLDYKLRPYKNDDHPNGISTLDIIYIQRHILGLSYLDSPYKVIASDVTHDERTNGQDLVQLRKLLLGQIDTFLNNTSWRFVTKDYVFADTLRPFPFDEDIILRDSIHMGMHNDFVGVKIGDVDNSIVLGLKDDLVQTRSNYNIYYSLKTTTKEQDDLIPVFSNELGLIYGFQFSLELEQGEIVDVLPGSIDFSNSNYVIREKREVAFSWNSELGAVSDVTIPLFYLRVKDQDPGQVVLTLNKTEPKAEIYIGENLTTKVPSLSLYDDTGKSQFVLYQNEPNPFKDWTDIKFYLPSEQEVNLSFYGADGQKLYGIIDRMSAGEHSFRVSSEQFDGNSVVYYNLSTELYNDSKKMIIVK